jgi:hypothetical protein
MKGEVALFLYELVLEGSRLFHTHTTINIIVPKCILELETTKHNSQSSKTNLWSSNLSWPNSKTNPLILSSNAHTKDQIVLA